MFIIEPLAKLIGSFSKLPGIGSKTAMRLAFHILKMSDSDIEEFAKNLYYAKKQVKYCENCGNLCEDKLCHICRDTKRNPDIICVVEDFKDVLAFERTNEFKGLYHVLGGTLSPIQGVGPDDLNIKNLLLRIQKNDSIKEIILATNPDVKGETTATYLHKLLKPTGLKLSRIAHGIPVGGDLEYTDEVTLTKALDGRREM